MTQIQHSPTIQTFLDEMADKLGIGTPVSGYDGHEDCDLLPGSKLCLNECSPLCDSCDFWLDFFGEDE